MKRWIYTGLWMVALNLFVHLVCVLSLQAEEFTDALNRVRTEAGLRPVAYDAGLEPTAARNNALQATNGQGHWHTGGYGQCAYVGPIDKLGALFGYGLAQVDKLGVNRWFGGIGYLQSPSHAAILLHPSARRIAIDHSGNLNTVVIAFTDAQAPPAPAVVAPKKKVESKPASQQPGPPTVSREAVDKVCVAACPCSPCTCAPTVAPCQVTKASKCGARRAFRFHPLRDLLFLRWLKRNV